MISSPAHRLLIHSPDSPHPRWKRMLDLSACALVLPVCGLICLVVTAWIVLVAPGPIFFRQERVGYKGRKFMLYKLRTMSAGADTTSHCSHFRSLVSGNRPMQKLDGAGDSRLIPGGWLLRALGIDELPQLINVLRGDMSLVGPRPCIPYEYEQYTAAQRDRFSTVPGLTGLWQVSGKNRTTFDEMVRLDIQYSRTKSLLLDLQIVARTLPALWQQLVDTHVLRRTHSARLAGSAQPAPLSTTQT
jgi:exopolysaccharide production protein ExoY